MDSSDKAQSRLSQIETRWSMMLKAADGPIGATSEARKLLLLRYHRAAYRYLLGAVRSPDAAEELAQELALRFLRGDFHRAQPERGRFRDYLKATLVNLVAGHYRALAEKPEPLPVEPVEPDRSMSGLDVDFLNGWRAELIDRASEVMAKSHPVQHAVLTARVEDPAATSRELAERLARKLGKPVRDDQVRKALQRAHSNFAELLLDEVARSLGPDSGEVSLEQELRELGLLGYCQAALGRRADEPAVHDRTT